MGYREDFRMVEHDAYWSYPRILLMIIALCVAVFVIAFISTGGDLAMFKFWQPKIENAKREVFEQTQSYVEGKISYLTTLRFQYTKATGEQKAALRSLILSEASTVDNSKLPGDLQGFIQQLKGE